jgi:hypothetical protein
MLKNWQKKLFLITLVLLGVFLFANFVSAQVEVGLNYAAATGLGTTDIRITIANIIRVFLGLLGILAVGLILYGGFVWMTAAGNEENIKKAKKILIGGVIGLLIVLSAFAIASWIISAILEATGVPGGGGVPGGCVGPQCYGCTGPGCLPSTCLDPDPTSDGPYICQLSPTTGRRGSFVTIYGGKFSSYDAATSKVVFSKNGVDNNATITLCNGNPSWSDNTIVVEVPNLTDLGDYMVAVITASGNSNDKPTGSVIAPNNRFTLEAGMPGPGIACIVPNEGKEGTAVDVYGKRFGTAAGALKFQSDVSATVTSWADEHLVSSVPAGAISGEVFVYDSGNVRSDNGYNFRVYCTAGSDCSATNCCLGNSCAAAEYCAPGQGENCDSDTVVAGCQAGLCQPGLFCDPNQNCTCQPSGLGAPCDGDKLTAGCQANSSLCGAGLYCSVTNACTCQYLPEITKIDPDNGAPGNYVTIFGRGFGDTAGKVFFTDNKQGLVPTGCGAFDLWQDNQIIIEIPSGAVSGPVRVRTTDGLEAISPADFIVNDITRPSLCGVKPDKGELGASVTLDGKNFGTTKASAQIGGTEFGDKSGWLWTAAQISQLKVPNILPATLPVQVKVGANFSNPVNFTVLPTTKGPKIDYIDPTFGPTGQYVTIFGSNFGETAGTVYFSNGETNTDNWQRADTNFPPACLQIGYWHDSQIIVKAPAGILNDSKVIIKRADGVNSNTIDFRSCSRNNTTCPLSPGICAIKPNQGPVGTSGVAVYGDNFADFGAQSKVLFWENKSAGDLSASWQNNQVSNITVPVGAVTGPVTLVDKDGFVSNKVNFNVADCRTTPNICQAGLECCQVDGVCKTAAECAGITPQTCTYAWAFSTGKLPPGAPQVVEDIACADNTQSPSPWKNSVDNCVNAQISARFSQAMDKSTFTTSNIIVSKCSNTDTYDETTCTSPVEASGIESISDNYGFVFHPAGILETSTWYKVTLSGTGLKSDAGIFLDGDFNGNPGGDYTWHFRISSSDELCEVDHVVVTPAEPNPIILTSLSQNQAYQGNVFAANCNMLNAYDYPWKWSLIEIVKNFGTVASLYPTDQPTTLATPLDQGKDFVKAEIYPNDAAKNKFDTDNELDVDLGKPEIERIYPEDGIVRAEAITNVTIYGHNFGATQGSTKVLFGNVEAALVAKCVNNWSDEMIMVKAPLAAYPNNLDAKEVKIVKATGGESNTKTFTRDDSKIYPFLCSLDPSFGLKGEAISATGENFGDSNKNVINNKTYSIGSNMVFSPVNSATLPTSLNVSPDDIKNWTNELINFLEPINDADTDEARVTVQITPSANPFIDTNKNGLWDSGEAYFDKNTNSEKTDNNYVPATTFPSNDLPFYFKPVITSVSPDNGPNKQWITITGYNFGNTPGVVCFGENCGQYFPPLPCKNTWTNKQIIAVVPDGLALGDYALSIKTSKNLQSNSVGFTVNTNPLGPGLCQISPGSGYVNTIVTVKGDRFGDTKSDSQLVFTNNKNATTSAWSDKSITGTVPNGAVLGNVVVTRKIQIGQSCVGFSIGSFCPSNQYSPVYATLQSNPLLFTVLTGAVPPTPPPGATQCTTDSDCQKGGCTGSKCVDGYCTPFIKSFSPTEGPLGTWTTLNGCYFGCEAGEVYFSGNVATSPVYKTDEKAFYQFAGNANDSSGNNYNLVNLLNGAAVEGGVLNLDGIDDFAMTKLTTYYEPDGVNLSSPGDALSISAWINIPSYPSTTGTIISQGGGNYAPYKFWMMYIGSNGGFGLQTSNHPLTGISGGTRANFVPLNRWVNLVMVLWYTSADDTTHARGYMNGVEAITFNQKGRAIDLGFTTYKPLVIGSIAWTYPGANGSSWAGNARWFFKGQIDDVRLYNRALSGGEIKRIFDYGHEGYNNGLGYNKKALMPENPNCTFWNCSATGQNDWVVAEVPNAKTETTNDDAQTGPIEIITSYKGIDNTSDLIPGNFTVNTNPLPPNICKLDPGVGPRETIVKVYGDNLKFSNGVNFVPKTDSDYLNEPYLDAGEKNGQYDSGETYIDINNNAKYDSNADKNPALQKSDFSFSIDSSYYVTSSEEKGCPENYQAESGAGADINKTLCFRVPSNAAGEGQSNLTALNSVSIKKGGTESNKLDYSVNFPSGSTAAALKIEQTVPTSVKPFQTNFCRNGIIDIYFNDLVDPTTISKDNFLLECSTKIAKGDNIINKGLAFVKNIFVKLTGLDNYLLAANTCPLNPDDYKLSYINYEGKTIVEIIPNDLLDAGASFKVTVKGGDAGVKKYNGALLDVSNSPVADTDSYIFGFQSAGDPALPDTETNGICQVNNILVFVSSTPDLNSEILRKDYNDLFTCAGNTCQSEIDYDQSGSLDGNQHKYHAVAKFSGGITLKAIYTWSKSDSLDPQRALSFHEIDSDGTDVDTNPDEYKFTNTSGKVYVTDAPIKVAVAKLIIQAQAQGVTSNVKSQDFTVYLLLCKNPWPSLDERTFPQAQINAYNFGTWYCRDAGDPNRTDDDLPPAKILSK